MNLPVRHAYHLVRRGGRGLTCDEDGLALGSLALARTSRDAQGARRCEVRTPAEIERFLHAAYGPQPDGVALRIHRGLQRAAAWIEAGDLGRAGIEAVRLGVPDLAPEALEKLAQLADLEKAGDAWEDQPRVPAGQTGAGQWTDDGGGGQAANPPQKAKPSTPAQHPARRDPHRSPVQTRPKAPHRTVINDRPGLTPAARRLLIHVSSPAIAANPLGAGAPGLPRINLPSLTVPLPGPAQVVSVGARVLDASTILAARHQIGNAISRFGLDPSQRSDVMAAAAYVWSIHHIAGLTEAPFSGPGLDAASQAVMRFVLIHPDAFAPVLQGDTASRAILDAAEAGLADSDATRRVRPAGVEPALQTTSRTARAAIANELRAGRMVAHHLVPVEVYASNLDIARKALVDGWKPDNPSNLIGLPYDVATQRRLPMALPRHVGSHYSYSTESLALVQAARDGRPGWLSPVRAHAIFDEVARIHRDRILTGAYGDLLKGET